MRHLQRILAVLDGSDADVLVMTKAVALAREQRADLELFLCDAARAYCLMRAYDLHGVEDFRRDAVRKARRYLEGVRDTAVGADVAISLDASCETPLYEGIVRKVLRSKPDLVIKSSVGGSAHGMDPNDWQLLRSCPATLLLNRGRSWHGAPKLVAAVDMSDAEIPELRTAVLATSDMLSRVAKGAPEVLYSEAIDVSPREHAARVAALEKLTLEAHVPGDHVHVLRGDPEAALPQFAAPRGYDVLIMGALAHGGGITSRVGSLTARLIESLDCDFVLVKPGNYRSSIELRAAQTVQEHAVTGAEPRVTAGAELSFITAWELPQRAGGTEPTR